MNTVKRKQDAADALADELGGTTAKIKKHANTALTVLLAVAAIYLLIKWRIDSVERTRQLVINELNSARNMVDRLRSPDFPLQPTNQILAIRTAAETEAPASLQTVFDKTSDAKLLAQANIVKGDLYWQLANLPELPGATTQPSLRSALSSDDLLKRSAASYNEVLNNEAFKAQADSKLAAHFGLAAIAENQADWAGARKHLETVLNDSSTGSAMKETAKAQLAVLPQLQNSIYLAPATQASAPVALPNFDDPASFLGRAVAPSTKPATTQPVH